MPVNGELKTVMALLMGDSDKFIGRVDAQRARLGVGYWVLYDATVRLSGAPPRRLVAYRLETDLTMEKIQESFADPATLSFWALPGFVRVLEAAGFPATRHKLHWQSLLALPLLLAAVVMVAATFSLRPIQRGGTRLVIVTGMVCGFTLFILMDVVSALGAASRIPIWLSAWSPIIIAMLLGSAMLFHLEDG